MVTMVFDFGDLHDLIFKTVFLGFLVAHSLFNGSSLGLGGYYSFLPLSEYSLCVLFSVLDSASPLSFCVKTQNASQIFDQKHQKG